MKILILGKGNVGRALAQFHDHHDVLAYHDPFTAIQADKTVAYDVGHITYPMKDMASWVYTTQQYMQAFKNVGWWMIHSTIDPAALEYFPGMVVVYSPIRATEAIMEKQVAQTRKYWSIVGDDSPDLLAEITTYITDHFPNPLNFGDARSLALGKLFEVADFGIQIALAQMMQRICDLKGYSFADAYSLYRQDSEYGANYTEMGPEGAPKEWVKRAIFQPGVIGGKCVMQDIDLLERGMLGDMDVWRWVKWSNERRKREELTK